MSDDFDPPEYDDELERIEWEERQEAIGDHMAAMAHIQTVLLFRVDGKQVGMLIHGFHLPDGVEVTAMSRDEEWHVWSPPIDVEIRRQ